MTHASHPCLFIGVSADRADEVSYQLFESGATAVEERDRTTMCREDGDQSLLIAGFESRESRDRAGRELEAAGLTFLHVRAEDIDDDGWSTRWKEFHKPVLLERLEVVAPWQELPRSGRQRVVIDPGQAFGTGGHATTRLILELLESQDALPDRILDVGSGSGVLAIAAVKLGAEEVTAVDIENESVAATAENARLNGVSDAVRVLRGSAGDLSRYWPLVLANLELSIFLRIAADVAERVAPGGTVLISGVLTDQVEDCLDLFRGFRSMQRLDKEGWAALELRREP